MAANLPPRDPGAEPPAFLTGLNDRQREASTTTEGPLIVLAGAGSGKTKMLTARISYLIECLGVPAHHILAVTFTNKAAAEMRERVEKMLGLSHNAFAPRWGGTFMGAPELGTFHSVCVRFLRRELSSTPFSKPFVIYDDSDQLSLVKESMEKLAIDDKAFNPKSIQGAINRLKCDALEPHELEPAQHDIMQRQVKRVYEQYQKDLFANNALDFGEILCMAYRVLRDHPEVRAKYQQRWRFIHVDEYQDTNRAQYLLLQQLASKKHGGHENICVVGDEDQSIYKWRGADINNILDFESDYPGAQVVKLEQNYRSTKTIIQAASQVISNNKSRKEKTLWTDNEEGLPIVRMQLANEHEEAGEVVKAVKRLAENEGRAYSDFAIFYRTNGQSRQFEAALSRDRIPYQVIGGQRFYDRKEIKDVLAYFRVILNPTDSISLKRIINTPARGIGKTTLDKIEAHLAAMNRGASQQKTYWDALIEASLNPEITSAGTAKKFQGFTSLIDRLMREQPKMLLSALYHLILDETGYVRELKHEGSEESLGRIENLEELDTALQEFEEDFFAAMPEDATEEDRNARNPELLPTFIEQSTLASDADKNVEQGPALKMMTLHSSKGLEFPVVFMVGMEEGLFPSIKQWEEVPEEDIEEERRLCYVGMTRAREQLFLMNVVQRSIWGQTNYQEPSRFFLEMPQALIELKDLSRSHGSSAHAFSFRPDGARKFGAGNYGSMDRGRGSIPSGPRRVYTDDDDAPPSRMGSVSVMPPVARPVTGSLMGQGVDHPEYGEGKIVLVEGSGDDQKVTVEFRGGDRRKFLLRYLQDHLE